MTCIWAVARQMIAEGIRMKIAFVFLVLIGVVLVGLPFSIEGDGSVAGAVQSFISYSLLASGFFLSLLTIFMSRSLSDDFVNQNLFLIVSKPIPRWQFILGKWAGMTLLNLAFLSFAGLSVYGMVRYIQSSHPTAANERDARELHEEVLTARHARKYIEPDLTALVEQEFEKNLELGIYANRPDFDPEAMKLSIFRKYDARWRLVPPRDSRVFNFDSVLCNRSKDETIQLRYKAEVTGYAPDEVFRAVFRFGDPLKGTPLYDVPVRHTIRRYHLVRAPADCVAEDHTLKVTFFNENPFAEEKQAHNLLEIRKGDDVEVLFAVGAFGWNLVRMLVLMMCKLMFLAAVSILSATVFSFPVACLTTFTIYVLASVRRFLEESFDFLLGSDVKLFDSLRDFLLQATAQVYAMLQWLLPDFGRFDALETLVNGRNVGLVWVLQGVADLVILKTVVVLGLAILLFYRREVAETSF